MRASWLLLGLGAVASVGGCFGQKAAEKIVDPSLVREGAVLERSDGERKAFSLGAYRFEQLDLKRTPAPNLSTGLSPDGQSRPSERIDLRVAMTSPRARWDGTCVAVREPTGRADYAAVNDEFHDVVQIDCDFKDDKGGAWTFAINGSLAVNLGGTLTATHASFVGSALEVEVLMWKKVWDRIKRHLPDAVGQVRLPKATIGAMVLARPEKAWLATDAPPEVQDAAMMTLGALRWLPMGFEG